MKAVENIRGIARSNLAVVEQISSSARDLAKQSEGLTKMVLQFRLE